MTPNAGSADRWASGTAYESYVGRWSRLVAVDFLAWLGIQDGARWLDVGSGTGALTHSILARGEPASVIGVDPSVAFVDHARAAITDARASFIVGSADATGLDDAAVDVAASGLVLNFVPDLGAALAELRRVVRPGGVIAGYVWDYGEGMELMRRFWDAAVSLDPSAEELDEGRRFPVASPEPLAMAFRDAGLDAVDVRPIVVPTIFADFDDLWRPFLSGTGPAPAHAASLGEPERDALRDRLRTTIVAEPDGTIRLRARAWAIRSRTAAR